MSAVPQTPLNLIIHSLYWNDTRNKDADVIFMWLSSTMALLKWWFPNHDNKDMISFLQNMKMLINKTGLCVLF